MTRVIFDLFKWLMVQLCPLWCQNGHGRILQRLAERVKDNAEEQIKLDGCLQAQSCPRY